MKKFRRFYKRYARYVWWSAAITLALGMLFLYRLGTIPGGMSAAEMSVAAGRYGWHGLFDTLLFAPINIVRSIIFFAAGHHGQLLTRLPNALFGISAVIGFAWLLRLWHGTRTAVFGSILFATAAWTLHSSRIATNDVMYLWAMVVLLVTNALVYRHSDKLRVLFGAIVAWSCLLFIPGMVWLVALNLFWQRKSITTLWSNAQALWQKSLVIITLLLPLGVLIASLIQSSQWLLWLGLPDHMSSPLTIVRNFFAIPYHLYVRGPLLQDLWLDRLPVLDIMVAVTSVIGLFFYSQNMKSGRSRMLASVFGLSLLLIAFGGLVSISLILPLMYGLAATGLAYLLREWLQVFPINPFARSLGIGLIVCAISFSALYNMRAYFVAWPHNPVTQATFRYHLP